MLDFQKLVESALLTEAKLTAGTEYALVDYYMHKTDELKNVSAELATKFSINTWPNESSPNTFLALLASSVSRINATPLLTYANVFPLMDFLWFVGDKVNGPKPGLVLSGHIKIKKGPGSAELTDDGTPVGGIAKEFIDSLASYSADSNPLYGYTPLSTTGAKYITVLQRKVQDNFLGEFNLNEFSNFSLKATLYGLLEMRKKTRNAVVNTNKNFRDINWLDAIVENPQKYAGTIQIPSELKDLYNDASATQILEISNNFHMFYDYEVLSTQAAASLSSTPITTFQSFISNENLVDNTFKFFFSSDPSTGTESPSFSAIDNAKGGYTIKNVSLMPHDAAKKTIEVLKRFGNYIYEGESTEEAEKKTLNRAQQLATGAQQLATAAKAGGTFGTK